MTAELIVEINRLHAAVDDFASAMKTRLTQKAEAGFTGWDGAYPEGFLWDEIAEAGAYARTSSDFPKLAVDVANRAMMLWWRRTGHKPNTGGEH
jgi:hypothetical protein